MWPLLELTTSKMLGENVRHTLPPCLTLMETLTIPSKCIPPTSLWGCALVWDRDTIEQVMKHMRCGFLPSPILWDRRVWPDWLIIVCSHLLPQIPIICSEGSIQVRVHVGTILAVEHIGLCCLWRMAKTSFPLPVSVRTRISYIVRVLALFLFSCDKMTF